MGSCVLPGGNSHDRQRNARSLFGCIDFRSSPTQPASREDHQVEKCQTNPRDAEFFLQQTSAANCGAPTTPPLPPSPTAGQSPFLLLLFHIRKSAPCFFFFCVPFPCCHFPVRVCFVGVGDVGLVLV